ncbi:MAG TPA: LysM domain-containing protein, partial [Ottowia sp.]|nr:LysM domain-containing protein [Ottowia sp.]
MKLLFPGATRALVAPLGLLTAALLGAPPAAAQAASRLPVTPMQRATAQQVAAQGVPLSALAPDAPDQYTVRRGDTLWRISSLFLKSPWRWPELWGMNLQDIRNPHLIYPGQQLYLERLGDRAFLRARRGADGEVGDTVRVSPRNRIEMLGTGPLPTLEPHLIEPFLTEPLVVDDDSFQRAPRIVALANQSRVLVAKGDRAYVRGPADAPLLKQAGDPTEFRVFRNAKPLKDPVTGETLGYEGHYVGQATLVRGESEAEEDAGAAPAVRPTRWPANGEVQSEPRRAAAPQPRALPVPATVDVISSKEEMRAGDRLLPEPPR